MYAWAHSYSRFLTRTFLSVSSIYYYTDWSYYSDHHGPTLKPAAVVFLREIIQHNISILAADYTKTFCRRNKIEILCYNILLFESHPYLNRSIEVAGLGFKRFRKIFSVTLRTTHKCILTDYLFRTDFQRQWKTEIVWRHPSLVNMCYIDAKNCICSL